MPETEPPRSWDGCCTPAPDGGHSPGCPWVKETVRWSRDRAETETPTGHAVTITPADWRIPDPHHSIPYLFGARCACGWSFAPNAPKWTLLAVQTHYIERGFTNGRGLLNDEFAGV